MDDKDSSTSASSSSNANMNDDTVATMMENENNYHPHNNIEKHPPEGFVITARVYTDPNDKLAHFDSYTNHNHNKIVLPYWECNAVGSTTSPLPIKDAYFRHSLHGSYPTIWSGEEYGPHPQLVIALKEIDILLNSKEVKKFQPGEVILLEDVIVGGHKIMSSSSTSSNSDMEVLILTLPQNYHHVGRENLSILKATKKITQPTTNHPCPVYSTTTPTNGDFPKSNSEEDDDDNTKLSNQIIGGNPKWMKFKKKPLIHRQSSSSISNHPQKTLIHDSSGSNSRSAGRNNNNNLSPHSKERFNEDQIKVIVLGIIGLSLSTYTVDFLGKVAPLWLAVGIGGTCFIVGGTYTFIKVGEYIVSEIEMWYERRRLRTTTTTTTTTTTKNSSSSFASSSPSASLLNNDIENEEEEQQQQQQQQE